MPDKKNFRLGRFHLDNIVVLQLSSNDKIRIPLLYNRHSLYYKGSLFKGATFAKVGFDIRYNSNYDFYAFAPAISQFYLQNEQTWNNYPVIDLFANFRVKTVRLFITFKHLNEGLLPIWRGYFTAADYPMSGRTFYFGFSWMFFD